MAISDKTRKRLWANSGGLCAICKTKVLKELKPEEKHSIVGDECHIVARAPDGPRGELRSEVPSIDSYENLIILCRNCHKIIDEYPDIYTVDKLRKIKHEHEVMIAENHELIVDETIGLKTDFLPRILTGQDLIHTIGKGLVFEFHKPEDLEDWEYELIGTFLELCSEWGEILSDLPIKGRFDAERALNKELKELESARFYVFGANISKSVPEQGFVDPVDVSVLSIVRQNDPQIIRIDFNELEKMIDDSDNSCSDV